MYTDGIDDWMVTFQSTPAIAGGRISALCGCSPQTNRFNPRPPLLAGESSEHVPVFADKPVSIHARHCWRANHGIRTRCAAVMRRFNPRPPLLAGESKTKKASWLFAGFQSTPAIAGGRIPRRKRGLTPHRRFNPRPPLLAGESGAFVGTRVRNVVSIHARHCWRANLQGPGSAGSKRCCFNPRPPLLAGESQFSIDSPRFEIVSIHARHCWRANLAGLDSDREAI